MRHTTNTTPAPHTADKPQEPPTATAHPHPRRHQERSRVLTQPQDVLRVVLKQLDAVNDARDELTVALKGLTDLTKQLVRAYVVQTQAVQTLQRRVQALEAQERQ